MTEPERESTRTTIKDQKVIFGEQEFTNLIRTLVRVYRYRSNNQTPIAIVIPDVKEVEGVKVEFPESKEVVEDVGDKG